MLCFSRVSNSLLGWQGKVILRRAACLLSSDSKALRPMYRSDYQPSDFQLPRVELSFNLISPENTSVHSRLHLSKRDQSQEKDLVLDGIDISLQSVSVGQLNAGSVLTNPSLLPSQDYFVDEDKLTIRSHVLPQAKEFVVDVAVTLNPKENLSFAGLYVDGGGSYITQCEAHGFRRITYSLDRPDVLSEYVVSLTADKATSPVLLSNGNLISSVDEDGGKRHTCVWHDPQKKPSYLFAIVAGDLGHIHDTFQTMSGKTVDLFIYSEKKNVDQLDFAMYSLKRSMLWDEQKYGREYDLNIFNIVATDSFNMGAMENKSLNIFNTAYVLGRQDVSTDDELTNVLRVIGHEYFHNWTGNRVTCRDWFQLTLKEGLTVFRDQQFTADETSEASKRIDEVALLRAVQFSEDAGALAHPIRPEKVVVQDNFYTPTVYDKGAEVIRMYHSLMGAQLFRKGMDLYFERHDGHAVTCDDFRFAMADAALTSGQKCLSQLFRGQFEQWYLQDGTPTVHVSEASTITENSEVCNLTITFAQSCKPSATQLQKKPYVIPIKMGLLDPATGKDIELSMTTPSSMKFLHGDTLILTEAEDSVTFENVPVGAVLSVFRGLSAPVNAVLPAQTENHLAFLTRYDRDPLNRYDAAQRYGKMMILNAIKGGGFEVSKFTNPEYLECIRGLLNDTSADPALKAAALALPSFNIMKSELTNNAETAEFDPELVYNARKAVMTEVANALKDDFLAQYHASRSACSAYTFSPEQVAQRRFAATCLKYLTYATPLDAIVVDLCSSLYHLSDNMTDQNTALVCLSDLHVKERTVALDSYVDRWKSNSLAMNRWFRVQAMSALPGGVDRAIRLMKHDGFEFTNPNKLMSVVGSFCVGNPQQFHAKDGSGYQFLGDVIRRIDPMNPQIGAALAKLFVDWTIYDSARQKMIKAQLESIIKNDGASANVIEVCQTALDAEKKKAKL